MNVIKTAGSKIVQKANGKQSLTITKADWEKIGEETGWAKSLEVEAKKKKKRNPNPWAVCHTTVDKDKNPEKYERCVQDVKEKQK